MNPKISIIVPVYNVEKYIGRCVESLLAQTYKNIEILLINDGSTDNSLALCKELEAKYQNIIKVLNQENKGQSSARNYGLQNISGEFIGFVDSDDWIEKDMYEYLHNLIVANDADVAQIDFVMSNRFPFEVKNPQEKLELFNDKEILQYFMTTTTTTTGSYSVCRCLFKKDLLSRLYFREGKINEDIDYKYLALSRAKRFVVSNQIKYVYFQGSSSTTRGGLRRKDFDLYDAAEELYKLTQKEDYGTIRFLGEVKKARTSFSLLSKIVYYGLSDDSLNKKNTIMTLKRDLRKGLGILLKAPLGIPRKVLALVMVVNISIPTQIFRVLRIIRHEKL
ncbi:MAG: glycosyltransferase family 2 protein [Clostridia bacterium]